jgi:Domain of unknown function (DUF397)
MNSDRRNVMAPGDQAITQSDAMVRQPKPTVSSLGMDLAELTWQRSGVGAGSLEVAFVGGQAGPAGPGADWVLLRVTGDPAGRVLIYDRVEWMCFLDGAGRGEFG